MSSRWTGPDDLRDKVRLRWDDGTLLRAWAQGAPFPTVDLPLRGPKPGEVGEDLEAVRSWVAALEAGRLVRGRERYALAYRQIGGRHIGRNQLPHRAQVTTYEQAWALLGVATQVAQLAGILDIVECEPAVHTWVQTHPLLALQHYTEWPSLLAAYRWLVSARDSGRYLREITAPGVDTKFAERHRSVLAQLLDVPTSASGFIRALGLAAKPETLRLRFNPGSVPALPALTEAWLRAEEIAQADLDLRTAVIVENEITYLSVPVPADGVVLWGKGFDANRAGSLPWLGDAEVHYWGDLDSHGFAILHQLRSRLPQTRSFLMDRDTLLAHRERWVHELTPTAARLDRLSPDEATMYADLVSDRFGELVRLEQERIDWAWVQPRLPYLRAST